MKIGVFDSGIGGLTVLRELIKYHPNQHYIYVGDNKNLPYGNKTKDELFNLSCKIINFLIKQKVDMIVIACGTVSSNVYNELKSTFNIPIISIVDTTISKIKQDGIQNIGILGTPSTINSHIFKEKLKDINVAEISCGTFVPLIEGQMEQKFKKVYIEQYLGPLKKEGIKDIVLGCTHYPLLENEIKNYLGDINIYNMGTILANSIYLKPSSKFLTVYFTENSKQLNSKVNNILNQNIETKQLKL